MATLIYDVAKHANGKGIHSLSEIPAPTVSTTNVGNLNVWFDPTTNGDLRLSTLTNPNLGFQSATIVNGNVTLLTAMHSTYVGSNNADAIAYSLGDRFQSFDPSWSSKAHVSHFLISILPTSVADASGFQRVTQGLDALPPADGGGAGLERFNSPGYNNMEPDTFPTLVYIPVVAKLPFMHHVPTNSDVVGLDLQNEEIATGTNTEGWIMATQWLLINNNGESLHHASAFFDVANLQLNGAPFPQAGDLCNTCNFHAPINSLHNDGSNEYDSIVAHVQTVITVAAMNGGINHSDRGPPSTPDTVIKTMSTTEQQRLKTSLRTQMFYKLFFVGYKNGNLCIPELSNAYTDFLGETNPVSACKIFGDSLQDFINHESERVLGTHHTNTTLTGDDFYPYLIRCLLDGNFSKRILAYAPTTIQKEITIFSVLSPNKATQAYKEVINEGHKALELMNMGTHKSQLTTPVSSLYTGGKIGTRIDAKSAIANALLLFSFMLKEPLEHEAIICSQLKLWSDRLDVNMFKHMIEQITEGPNPNKYFITHYLNDVQKSWHTIADFAASAHGKSGYEQQDLLPELLKITIENLAMLQSKKDSDFSNANLSDYNQMPTFWQYLAQPAAGKPAVAQQQQQSKNDTDSPDRKKQKKDKNQSPTSVTGGTGAGTSGTPGPKPHSIHGLLVAAEGAGLPTLPRAIRAKNVMKNNTLTPLCRAHLVEGTVCKNKDCNYAHVNANTFHARIPDPEHQKLFCDFVNNPDSKFSWKNNHPLTPQGS